jgi:putative ABC transport system permease protein
VGVVGDVALGVAPFTYRPLVYLPFHQDPNPQLDLVVATAVPSGSIEPELRRAMRIIDPDQPIWEVRPIEQVLDAQVEKERARTWLMAAAACVALLLAAAGVYAVIAYGVAQRTREIGIRIAFGARRLDVLTMVVGQGAVNLAIGLALGSAGAEVVVQLLARAMWFVYPISVETFVVIAAALALAAVVASLAPARRAFRIDPMAALRHE